MKSIKICVAAIMAGVVCIAVMLGILSAAIYAENESGNSFIAVSYTHLDVYKRQVNVSAVAQKHSRKY